MQILIILIILYSSGFRSLYICCDEYKGVHLYFEHITNKIPWKFYFFLYLALCSLSLKQVVVGKLTQRHFQTRQEMDTLQQENF